jgi:hypothetical protein
VMVLWQFLAACGTSDAPPDPPRSEEPSRAGPPTVAELEIPPRPTLPTFEVPPSWSLDGPCEVPQIPDAAAAFWQAGDLAAEQMEGGALICQVVFSQEPPSGLNWDALGGRPDPAVQARFGGQDRSYACAEDTFTAFLSWPGLSLEAGEKLFLDAQDRDSSSHDYAGVASAVYEGRLPMVFSSEHFLATCRALRPEVVAARLSGPEQAARAALAAFSQALDTALSLEPGSPGWGFPVDSEARVRQALLAVAAYADWEAPPTSELLAEYQASLVRWTEESFETLRDYRAQLPPSAELGGIILEEVALEGGSEVAVSLLMTSPEGAHGALTLGAGGWSASALTAEGEAIQLAPAVATAMDGGAVFFERTDPMVLTLEAEQPTAVYLEGVDASALEMRSLILVRFVAGAESVALPLPEDLDAD